MSNWTHVSGVVRIDTFGSFDHHSGKPDFEIIGEWFGKELHFGDEEKLWDEADEHPERFLPLGSEGSLRLSVWTNPVPNHTAKYTVTVFGDLRDHDSADEIVAWFKDVCGKIQNSNYVAWIRNAVVLADNEQKGVAAWHYDEERDGDING